MRVAVANRGEIAVRIVRAARECGYSTLVMYTGEESGGLPVRLADEAVELPGSGAAAYVDVGAMVAAAGRAGGGALVHPGYGFLSESAEFATACADAGLVFVGPSSEVLRIFGDKVAARVAAESAGLAVLPATTSESGLDGIAALLADHPDGVMVKAAAGGGGRGMRSVRDPGELAEAYERCRAEARSGFGDDAVYGEALVHGARHVEVQIVADGRRAIALGDRDCSVQRRRQKLIEVAPAPNLAAALRERLHRDAVAIAESVGCRGVITVEFLVRGTEAWFLEVNPRLQVEHTVTEEVSGVDLVAVQFRLALGQTLADVELPSGGPRGFAVQARVNAEIVSASGDLLPSAGTLTQFGAPTGTGVRVDTAAGPGMRQSARFDSLLAKIIARGPSYSAALQRCSDALAETVVAGVDTDTALLRAVLAELPRTESVDTAWFEDNLTGLLSRAADYAPQAQVRAAEVAAPAEVSLAEDERALRSPMGATVVSLAAPGSVLPAGAEVAVLEAMKMQHVVRAEESLRVVRQLVAPGDVVDPHAVLFTWAEADHDGVGAVDTVVDLDTERDDLAEVRARHETTLDPRRPAAVAKRHELGRRTARENIADLVDADSFVEYGALTIAAQRARRSSEDLIANTPPTVSWPVSRPSTPPGSVSIARGWW